MKWMFFMFFMAITKITFSQNSVNYLVDNNSIPNPERGFYHHTETHSNNYSSLNVNTLSNYRVNENITLILRVFYLEDFKDSDISEAYLENVKQDLAVVRTAGLKCIVRFAYNNDQTDTDASKVQILSHLDQIASILSEYSDVIAFMQAGFIGSWGEWYYTTQTEFGLPGSTVNYTNRGEVVAKILDVLPSSRMVQLRTPTFKREIFNEYTALDFSDAHNGTDISRTGHHNDCFLASSTDFGTYANITTDKNYLSQECLYTVNGGETCATSEFSGCVNALSDLSNLRYSYLNTDYNRTVLDVWETDGCMGEVLEKLGYKLVLTNGEYSSMASAGDSVSIYIELENQGWASPYNPRGLEIILRSSINPSEKYVFELSNDPRLWLPNEQIIIDQKIKIPSEITLGEYDLFLNLPDTASALKDRAEYSIRMSNQNTWESSTGYNDLQAKITITKVTALEEKNETGFTFFPNPVQDVLTLSEESTDTKIYSVTGEQVLFHKKGQTQFDVSNLSKGFYLIEVNIINKEKKVIRFVKQ